jgi:hypothetical protein
LLGKDHAVRQKVAFRHIEGKKFLNVFINVQRSVRKGG